jgi:hypothetical protein
MATSSPEADISPDDLSLPIFIPEKAEQSLVEYHKACLDANNSYTNQLRTYFEEIDKDYERERDTTVDEIKSTSAVRSGDANKFRNITVPVVYPIVEEAVTYQVDVFLSGHPIFACVAPPDQMDAAAQMNAVIEENSLTAGWVRNLMLSLRDGFKYNLMAVETDWEQRVTPIFETSIEAGAANNYQKSKNVIWQGNVIRRLDPYNLVYDRRYHPSEVATRGEFAGYSCLMSRTELKSYIKSLRYKILKNIRPALESTGPQSVVATGGKDSSYGYYIPTIRKDRSLSETSREFNWYRWATLSGAKQEFRYSDSYVVSKKYARIIPADHGLRTSSPNTPQIWKLIYVNNDVLICAQRLTNIHDYLPITLAQPNEGGLGMQNKSVAEVATPYQHTSSAMMNSVIAARRRAISDRIVYNPSLISKQHMESENPSARIPTRPAAYGRNLNEAFAAIPFRDDQSGFMMQQIPQLMGLADRAVGQNGVRRGQFQKGNKTVQEFDSVMEGSTGRDRLTSISLEHQFFTPIKHIIKSNILQYQGVGKIFVSTLSDSSVNVDPVALRNAALQFKVSDGLTPTSKLISGDMLTTAFQTIGSSPQIAAGYNIGPLFSYLMKTQNADLKPFEKSPEQQAYEQAAQQWGMLAQMAIDKGAPFTAPQPTPQQFGWNPKALQAPAVSGNIQTNDAPAT